MRSTIGSSAIRKVGCIVFVCVLTASTAFSDAPALSSPLLAHADDYVFGFYPYGWRGRLHGDIVFAVQTSEYALLLNASRASIQRTGILSNNLRADAAARMGNETVIDGLENSPLQFHVDVGGTRFNVVSGAPTPDAVVIQRLGKYLVNLEVRGLVLESVEGTKLEDISCRLVLHCWPDHVRIEFRLETDGVKDISLGATYIQSDKSLHAQSLTPSSTMRQVGDGAIEFRCESPAPDAAGAASLLVCLSATNAGKSDALTVRATGIAPYTGELTVTHDVRAGWHQIVLGDNPDIWTMERVRLLVANHGEQASALRLAFSKRQGRFGITGMSPVLCAIDGSPLGLPVQISKNWHVSPPWFDGIAILHLEPHSQHELEFRLAYAHWGGVPAVSHAQLALEGWGTHQLWDECAIGSFGESITYDPDVNLGRAMIDDIRPLMVWGMGNIAQRKWGWTHNVGGGDFLVLHQNGERRHLVRQKTEYESYGPVLSTVHYTGETPDGALQTRITAQSWRSDDYVRGLYTLRYEVVKPLAFSRLAFFQFAADRYNQNLFDHLSRGDLDGKKESWTPRMGGGTYSRARVPLDGEQSWFAFGGNRKNPPPTIKEGDEGAWADRGLIVHQWRARLGGSDCPTPFYSVYGTDDGQTPSAIVELSPPPNIEALAPGDFVEALVEIVVLPQRAEDYYGPNESFREALRQYGGQWNLVHCEARGTNVRVEARDGLVQSHWPVIIRANNGRHVEFTISGGCGYMPITLSGLSRGAPFTLEQLKDDGTHRIEPSPNRDWWQSRFRPADNTFEISFTLPFDTCEDEGRLHRFRFSLDELPVDNDTAKDTRSP